MADKEYRVQLVGDTAERFVLYAELNESSPKVLLELIVDWFMSHDYEYMDKFLSWGIANGKIKP